MTTGVCLPHQSLLLSTTRPGLRYFARCTVCWRPHLIFFWTRSSLWTTTVTEVWWRLILKYVNYITGVYSWNPSFLTSFILIIPFLKYMLSRSYLLLSPKGSYFHSQEYCNFFSANPAMCSFRAFERATGELHSRPEESTTDPSKKERGAGQSSASGCLHSHRWCANFPRLSLWVSRRLAGTPST